MNVWFKLGRRGADISCMKSMTTGRRVWLATVALLAGLTAASFFGPWRDDTFANPELLFSLVIVSAVACVVGATIVIALADRRELAELGLLGSALMAASVMPLVHGLVTPGVLYDDTEAFRTSVFLSLPIAIAAGAPLLTPHSAFGRWAARHWRDWSLLCLLGVFAIGSVVVSYPDTIVTPGPSSPVTIAVCAALAAGVLALSLRQLRFYDLGGQPANLGASLSLVLLASTALLPLTGDDYSIAFWWLHVAGIAGVLGACIAMAVSKRMSKTAHDVLAPVLTRDPLVAFELGLSPVVHRFVASLDDKDPETRDHVIRTAEMAVRVGEHFRLSARQLARSRPGGAVARHRQARDADRDPRQAVAAHDRGVRDRQAPRRRRRAHAARRADARGRRADRALAPRADRRARLPRRSHRRRDPAGGAHHRRVRRVRRDDARASVPPGVGAEHGVRRAARARRQPVGRQGDRPRDDGAAGDGGRDTDSAPSGRTSTPAVRRKSTRMRCPPKTSMNC